MNTGSMTNDGFLPSSPTMDDLMNRITGGKGGWDGLNAKPEAGDKPQSVQEKEDLQKCYVQIAASPAGQRVIEDLLNQTLRRGYSHPDMNVGFEQEALYNRERKGQNGIVCYILKQIHDGRLIAPKTKSKSKK